MSSVINLKIIFYYMFLITEHQYVQNILLHVFKFPQIFAYIDAYP